MIHESKPPFSSGLFNSALLIILIWGLTVGRAFFIPVCLAAVLAFLMNPIVRYLRIRRVPHWIAVIVATTFLVVPLAIVVFLSVRQISQLIEDLPRLQHILDGKLLAFSQTEVGQRLHIPPTVVDIGEKMVSSMGQGLGAAVGAVKSFLELGSEFILVLIFAVVMLASRDHVKKSAKKLLAHFGKNKSAEMMTSVVTVIEKFLVGRLIIAAIMAAASIIILWLFGVGYAFLMGLFIGVMTFVPEVGFVISLIPVTLAMLGAGRGGSLLVVLAVLFGVHILEGNWMTPKFVGKSVNINALSTFLGIFAGGLMWGVWGMFLSIPVLAILRIWMIADDDLKDWGDMLAEGPDEKKPDEPLVEKA